MVLNFIKCFLFEMLASGLFFPVYILDRKFNVLSWLETVFGIILLRRATFIESLFGKNF